MTLPAPKQRFTPEEYLRLETAAETKHEYHAGEILAMSGGTFWHSRIIANVIGETRNRLKGSPCFVLDSNMRIRLADDDRYVYPDASVVCGEPHYDPLDKKLTTILNPKVVVEVLSESTEGYDRGAKFSSYLALESLSEYVLVSQDRPRVETYVRQPDGNWLFSFWRGLAANAKLPSLQIELPLSEVYAGITFSAVNGANPPGV